MASKITSDALLGETPDFNLRFPPLPKTLEEVSKLISEHADLPDTPRLADIVGADPIVAAFVLRRVNSVHHSVRRSVDDVPKAVRLLGYQEVVNIALAVGMMQLEEFMATEERTTIFQDIMKASIGAAYFAQELAVPLRLPQKNKAFIVGLQHAVGRLVLLYNRAIMKPSGPPPPTTSLRALPTSAGSSARTIANWEPALCNGGIIQTTLRRSFAIISGRGRSRIIACAAWRWRCRSPYRPQNRYVYR